MIKSLARTALWYVPNDRQVLYTGFGYIEPVTLAPHSSLGLPPAVSLQEVDRAVCQDLSQCALCMAPVLQEVALALNEASPGALNSKSFTVVG
jgi:hypothetical protein